jgi:galactose oxidase
MFSLGDRRTKSSSVQPSRRNSPFSNRRLVGLSSLVGVGFMGVWSALAQDPATVGQWSPVMTWPCRAIHAHVLPTGKVLFWDTSGNPKLWDPVTNATSNARNSGLNIFCSGHAFLADGQLFVAGGHLNDQHYVGIPNACKYNAFTNTWTQFSNLMNAARWYPTSTTLPSGNVLVISGQIDTTQGMNTLPQVWQTASESWRDLSTAQLALPYYPFIHVAPNGKVFCAGPSQITRYLGTFGTRTWTTLGNTNFGPRNWGSSVMYDDGKILLMGGTTCDPYAWRCQSFPTATAEIIDLNSPVPSWTYTGSMAGGRKNHNATLLPDGKILVTGGSRSLEHPSRDSTDPAYTSEMWDPDTGTWTVMASETVFRGYHSTAALLPDGRVVSGGGTWGGASAEVYSPPYLFNGARPTITSAPTNIRYGNSFFVGTPDATSISKVTMIGLTSVTHGFNMNQRISRLSFSQATGGLNVTAPSSRNNSPPGYYMVFILNSNGVPSVANIVRIGS